MIVADKENCTGCTACEKVCPVSAIRMTVDAEGFLYPEISSELCTTCGLCHKICPLTRRNQFEKKALQRVYAVKHRDTNVRSKSSSGGMFTAISEYILSKNGVIYGAVYDCNFVVRHGRAQTGEERDKMRGSKYVQSSLGDTLINVKSDLEGGRIVLFTGTPCQCAAVRKYLANVDCSRLYIMDLLCDGTPSPKFFKEYIAFIAKKNKDKVIDINFRDKMFGWNNKVMKIEMRKQSYCKKASDDGFYQLFFNHILLRPSCYTCIYANKNREGDITVGDFWGIDEINSDFSDENGVSLVIINTPKGERIFEAIKNQLDISCQTMEDAEKKQLRLSKPARMGTRRNEFWKDYQTKGIEYVLKKYTTYGFIVRNKRRIKKIVWNVMRKG